MSARRYHSPQRALASSFLFSHSVARVPLGTTQSTGGLADAPPRIADLVLAARRCADHCGGPDRPDCRRLPAPDGIEHPPLGTRVHVRRSFLLEASAPAPREALLRDRCGPWGVLEVCRGDEGGEPEAHHSRVR